MMKNLLKSDFYRLFKSLSFYICAAVAVLLFGVTIFLMDWTNKMMASQDNTTIPLAFNNGLEYAATAFMNSNILMIIGIFSAIFVTAEFAHGTMKNAVSKGFARLKIYLSKLITMVSAAFLIMLVSFIIGWVCATIVTGAAGGFTGDFILYLLKTAGIELLLITAFAAVLVMIAMIVRNLGGVIAIDVIGVMSLEMPLFLALQYLFRNKIEFSEFSLMYNILFYQMNTGATESDYLRSAIVGVVFLALSTALGIFLFRKSDVK